MSNNEMVEDAAKRIFETEIAFGDHFQHKRDQPYGLRWELAKEQNLFSYRLAMAQATAALDTRARDRTCPYWSRCPHCRACRGMGAEEREDG